MKTVGAILLLSMPAVAQQTSPFTGDAQAAEAGRSTFRVYCSPCHGIKAQGGRGPDLTTGSYAMGDRDIDLFRVISDGVPGTEMTSYGMALGDDNVWRLVTYIRSAARKDSAGVNGNAANGEKLFWSKGGCGQCHRVGDRGGRLGPDLTRAGRQRSVAYLRESVVSPEADITPGYARVVVETRDGQKITGVQKNFDNFSAQLIDANERIHSFAKSEVASIKREFRSMMPAGYGKLFSESELDDLVAYLATLRGAIAGRAGTTAAGKAAATDESTWLTYGKNAAGWRYSELAEINRANVPRVAPEWTFQTGIVGKFETTPLVRDGLMFVTAPSNHAFALDAATGRPLWHYSKPVPAGVNVCCGQVNRGFAMLGDTLFKVNLENTLVALDAKTGTVIWESTIDDFKKGYSSTVAPLAVKNLVIVGIAGAEFGTRGFIDAYDATTGKRVWRFWTIAAAGTPGGDTWSGDTWQRGGGSTWVTGTYDPDLNLIYWGTGNPGPDMNGDERKGDNLFSCSVVALDADTGKLKWHYQFTPHDVHDWDAVADPVLVEVEMQGRRVKGLLHANRNGFYYLLDRSNGKLLLGKPFTKVTWADGIGSDGRPRLISGQDPTEEGTTSCPSIGGGHNWQATTYSPQTRLYYFGTTEGCQVYYKTKQDYIEGLWYQGSTTAGIPTAPTTGALLAIEPATGDMKWRFDMISGPSSGLLSTAGGLVFAGDGQGYFFALDARSGKVLWKYQTGGTVISPPITYRHNGRQHIAIAAGQSLITFALPK